MFVKKKYLCMAAACIFCAAALIMAPAGPAGAESYKRIGRNVDTDAENVYCLPASSGGGDRYALVIGNGNYRKRVGRLRNPVNDATGLADTLCELGFEVMKGENLTQRQMKRAVRAFGKKFRRGGTALFFFSGHGVQVNGRNYLIPVGTEIEAVEDVELEALDVRRVLAEMAKAEETLNIVILDACRNNPFARQFKSAGNSGLAYMNAPGGTLIAYSTAPGSVAAEGPGRYSIYTNSLIRNIRTPGLKIEEMFKNVRKKVMQYTNEKQIPWESSSVVGDFYFAGGSTVVTRTGTGRLSLESPSGATVWINGRSRGRSPIAEDGLEPGQVRVRAVLDGYRDEETTLRIRRGGDHQGDIVPGQACHHHNHDPGDHNHDPADHNHDPAGTARGMAGFGDRHGFRVREGGVLQDGM